MSTGHFNTAAGKRPPVTTAWDSKLRTAHQNWTGDDGSGFVTGKSLETIHKLLGKEPTAGAAASYTFTFDTNKFDDINDATITLTSISAAGAKTTKTYTIKNDYSAVSPQFNAGASNATAAANLVGEINGPNGHNGKLVASNIGGAVTITQASISKTHGVAGNNSVRFANHFEQLTTDGINVARRFSGGVTKTDHFWAKKTNYTSGDVFDVYDLVSVYRFFSDRAVNINGEFKAYAPGTNQGPSGGDIAHTPTDACGVPYCSDMPD